MKNTSIKTAIALVFLVIFNAIFFFGGIAHSDANWCSYGFVTFAYVCLLATPLLAKGSTSAVLIGSLWLRAVFYFFAELVVGIICMFVEPESILWPMAIQGIMLGVFVVLQLASVLANDATTESLQKQKDESFGKQMLIGQLQMKAGTISDQNLKPILNRCLDALSNSPLQTYPETAEADLALSNAVNALCASIGEGNAEQIKSDASQVLCSIQQRNLAIKQHRKP